MSEWLLKKRGLYYRPNDCGYTGIRDYAGRYSEDEAKARAGSEISMIRFEEAPEFSDACFDDLVRVHLTKQRDEARAHIEELHAKMTCMCGDSVDHSPWAGHSPVSMFDYAVEQEVERRLAARSMPLQDHANLADDNERLSGALKSQIEQTWKESDRADKADHMRVAIETGKVHPALAIDVSEHRQQAYQTGWNDGYAEGFGKAKDAKS